MLTTILTTAFALTQLTAALPTERGASYAHVYNSAPGCTDIGAYTAYQLSMDIQNATTATSSCQDYCSNDSSCAAVLVDLLFPGATDGTTTWHQVYKCFLYKEKFDAAKYLTCDAETKWYGQVDAYDKA